MPKPVKGAELAAHIITTYGYQAFLDWMAANIARHMERISKGENR